MASQTVDMSPEAIAARKQRRDTYQSGLRGAAAGAAKDRINMMDLSGQEFDQGTKYATQPGVGSDSQEISDQREYKDLESSDVDMIKTNQGNVISGNFPNVGEIQGGGNIASGGGEIQGGGQNIRGGVGEIQGAPGSAGAGPGPTIKNFNYGAWDPSQASISTADLVSGADGASTSNIAPSSGDLTSMLTSVGVNPSTVDPQPGEKDNNASIADTINASLHSGASIPDYAANPESAPEGAGGEVGRGSGGFSDIVAGFNQPSPTGRFGSDSADTTPRQTAAEKAQARKATGAEEGGEEDTYSASDTASSYLDTLTSMSDNEGSTTNQDRAKENEVPGSSDHLANNENNNPDPGDSGENEPPPEADPPETPPEAGNSDQPNEEDVGKISDGMGSLGESFMNIFSDYAGRDKDDIGEADQIARDAFALDIGKVAFENAGAEALAWTNGEITETLMNTAALNELTNTSLIMADEFNYGTSYLGMQADIAEDAATNDAIRDLVGKGFDADTELNQTALEGDIAENLLLTEGDITADTIAAQSDADIDLVGAQSEATHHQIMDQGYVDASLIAANNVADLNTIEATGDETRDTITVQGQVDQSNIYAEGLSNIAQIGAGSVANINEIEAKGDVDEALIGAQSTADQMETLTQGYVDVGNIAATSAGNVNEIVASGVQTRGNIGAQTAGDLLTTAAEGVETRANMETQGGETRATDSNLASEERDTIGVQGDETRATDTNRLTVEGAETRATDSNRGKETRLTDSNRATEDRSTMSHDNRLKAKTKADQHQYASNLARSF